MSVIFQPLRALHLRHSDNWHMALRFDRGYAEVTPESPDVERLLSIACECSPLCIDITQIKALTLYPSAGSTMMRIETGGTHQEVCIVDEDGHELRWGSLEQFLASLPYMALFTSEKAAPRWVVEAFDRIP